MIQKTLPYILIIISTSIILFFLQNNEPLKEFQSPLIVDMAQEHKPGTDHSKFEILKKEFETGQSVTEACLSCHTERHIGIMKNNHWTWSRKEHVPGKGVIEIGKKNILNNFCIGIGGSEKTCVRCHIGYGWEDDSFDFKEPKNIDCLVCHDNSGTYKKGKGQAGNPDASVDLSHVAQNVGPPSNSNCGVCHFWGGGGNNVKHGDLDKALLDCKRGVDVHMSAEGGNLQCVDCHTTEDHNIKGKLYALSSENKNRITCSQCHTEKPHAKEILNAHNHNIACQTCHIPHYAKANSTKMIWDWSTSGRLDDEGKPFHEPDADLNHKYLSIKGTFVWDDHVEPEYYWFNGTANHQLITDKIDTLAGALQMNTLYGSYNDSTNNSKIWPVKVHRGKQIYDKKYLTLVQPKLWDTEKGKGAYWNDFDWNIAVAKGMEGLGLPYSGTYGFVETEMYWPLNHMVSPKEESLACIDCHRRENGRLAGLTDFYLPGRDRSKLVDYGGMALIILSLLGIIVHIILRIKYRKNCFL